MLPYGPLAPGTLSPDGYWVWTADGWQPAISPDGLWRWNGSAWAPHAGERPVQARDRRVVWVAAAAVLVIVAGALVVGHSGSTRAVVPTRPGAAPSLPSYPGAPNGTTIYAVPSRTHTASHVTYPQTPPVGGRHAPVWLNCGIYDQPVADENAVHSLEHGVVWITYSPGLDPDSVSVLRTVVKAEYSGRERYLILSPHDGLPSPVVASAWGVQLQLRDATDPRLKAFIAYFRLGPQTPEFGARCTSGVGDPVG